MQKLRGGGGCSDSLGTAAVSARNLTASNDILWGNGGMLIEKTNRIYGRKSYSSAILSTTNSIRITLEMNPSLYGQNKVP
jgi:hypothetical protein